jgi:3-dehydroquinate dehydratase/shikimate dehydrogenase
MSPLLHNTSFASAGLDCVYLPFRVPKGSLPAALEQFSWLPVNGYSVTIPHKAAAVQAARVHDSTVEQVGAANTLYRGPDGEWRSANTDYEAALDSLCEALQEGQPPSDTSPLAGKKVLMLGAGGVARAIGKGVLAAGAALTVCSRTKQRGLDLAQSLECQATQWENRGALFADVLINCTPVGMHPQVDDSPFAENWLREGMTVFDTIYNPERTLLIKQARDRGCRTVTGIEMFVRQAARQFELFTGKPGPVDEMRATLRNAISAVSSSP